MRIFKNPAIILLMMSLFSSCSSAQKLEATAAFTLGEVYFQKWVSGVKDGHSGFDIFIPVHGKLPKSFQLDSVYFRGKSAELKRTAMNNILYIGRFKNTSIQKPDINMSSDPNEEYGNQTVNVIQNFPFKLKESEGVIRYREDNQVKYFKIDSISEKPSLNYPSMRQNEKE